MDSFLVKFVFTFLGQVGQPFGEAIGEAPRREIKCSRDGEKIFVRQILPYSRKAFLHKAGMPNNYLNYSIAYNY